MHGVHTFLGWGTREAASAEAGKLLPGTWEASPAGRVGAYRIRPSTHNPLGRGGGALPSGAGPPKGGIHVPHSAPSGPPKRAYAIRPYSRVQALRVPSKLRRRPQASPAILRRGAHPAIFIPINLMVRGGGEIHCGPGTPSCEIWPDTRPTGTRQTALASVDAQSPRGLKKQEQRPDYIVIDDLAGATR